MVGGAGNTYQTESGLERAIVDLIRVGASGHGAGVRQLASRLVSAVPPGVSNVESFRRELHEAMSHRPEATGLRFSGGAVPVDADGMHPLVDVDSMPDGRGLVLESSVMNQLEEIVQERLRASELARAGVGLTRTLLLSGPPGVGKTLTSRWIAQSVGLPVVSLDLSAVVSSYLGASGRNIRSVLDYAKSGPCVLLLDEFDAVAKRRDDHGDVGELKRIVNVILVELDRWPDSSLLIAATNHSHLLDPAVGRRFDRTLELLLPGLDQRREVLANLIGTSSTDAALAALAAELTDGASGSDLVRMWNLVRRRAVLNGTDPRNELVAELLKSHPKQSRSRDMLWLAVHDQLGWSHRQIAELVNVSHPTVSKAVRRARGG
ncbi:AAA family ATPase [Mycobacteroides abscessus subsp. abscessus]|uniref:AAA family ATPase n=1 Tax=Mycobacteroides abscessus TaxID=36809 RepID=UPI0039EF35F9